MPVVEFLRFSKVFKTAGETSRDLRQRVAADTVVHDMAGLMTDTLRLAHIEDIRPQGERSPPLLFASCWIATRLRRDSSLLMLSLGAEAISTT
jgi:hypothetical protein